MRDLEKHLAASNPRASRRGSFAGATSTKSLPPADSHKQRRRTSLGLGTAPVHEDVPALPKKPMMRRASLGQMLGNAQKFFSKDDNATFASESSCSASVASADLELELLLREVKRTIKHHAARKIEMESRMESDLELAKARLSSGNQMGAILSMRRVHKNTTMLAYTAGARYQLAQIRDSLENHTCTDVSQHRRAFRDITEKLLKADAPTPSDAFLLNQLESQMEEVGF